MTSASAVPNIGLNDDNTIPALGLGVGELSDTEAEHAVSIVSDGPSKPKTYEIRPAATLMWMPVSRWPIDSSAGSSSRGPYSWSMAPT